MNTERETRIRITGLYLFAVIAFLCASAVAQTPFELTIESAYDVIPGHEATLDVILSGGGADCTEFDLRLGYDGADLHFAGATPGAFFTRCGWEYFSYRIGSQDFPERETIRFIGSIAEPGNGTSASCYLPNAGETLFSISLSTNPDCGNRCRILPVRFQWRSCSDNVIMLRATGEPVLSRYVYDFDQTDITDYGSSLPGVNGAPDDCLSPGSRFIDFASGAIHTVCSDELCIDRGDINCNGRSYEVSDAVLYNNFFILSFGYSIAPIPIEECSIDNSDVNADGIPLSVSDFVYLVRVITGDVNPYPKPISLSRTATLTLRRGDAGIEVMCETGVDLGAILLDFEIGDAGQPPERAPEAGELEMTYAYRQNRLRVFLSDIGPGRIAAGRRHLLTVPGESVRLIDAEAADYAGNTVAIDIEAVAIPFSSLSSYPNPFRSATQISLVLAQSSDWSVTIYNITGQVVRSFGGYNEAGPVRVSWDGLDSRGARVAAGVYFYRADAGGVSQTRKTILMK